jgi:chromosome segregation ATPase
MGPLNAELLAEMNERVEILMEENALMVEQKAKLTASLEDLQDELTKRTQELTSMAQHLAATDSQLKSALDRLERAERDREDAAGQTVGYSEELGAVRSELDNLREQLTISSQRYMDAETSLKDVRKQLAATATQAEENNLMNMRRTKVAEDRVRDLHALLLQKTQEIDSANEVIRKLRREYQSTRQDAEGMLQVMSGLERQVADYHSREEEVERLAKESRERAEDALSARDQALAREQLMQKEVDRLLEERRQMNARRQVCVV